MIDSVINDPAMPVFWGKNQAGMQANDELNDVERFYAIQEWLNARDRAVADVKKLQNLTVHKQLANRLLEPWLWHTVITTSTEWDNFFTQRCHKDAQPEMKAAAMAAQYAYYTSTPTLIKYGEWHLPFIDHHDYETLVFRDLLQGYILDDTLKKISVARCARVSYNNHDGVRDINKDLELFEKLSKGNHFSPFEHVATPDTTLNVPGNLKGWRQYRHDFPNENATKFVPNHPLLIGKI
jgi:thymidylate synthase ThyX